MNFDQVTASNIPSKSYFIWILMVLTPSRHLNWFQSYSFYNIDMSKSLQTLNRDDVRRHDSTVHYSFYDDVRHHDSSKLVNL